MTDDRQPHLLVDILPNGSYFDDKEAEALLIEELRKGSLVIVAQAPAENFLDILRARLGLAPGELPSFADWARFRYFLQRTCEAYLHDLSLPGFGAEQTIVRLGAAGDHPDMHQLLDAALGEPSTELYEIFDEDVDDGSAPGATPPSGAPAVLFPDGQPVVDELGRTLDPAMGGYPDEKDLTPDERANYLGGLEGYDPNAVADYGDEGS